MFPPPGATKRAGGSLRLEQARVSTSPYLRAFRWPYATSNAGGPENLATLQSILSLHGCRKKRSPRPWPGHAHAKLKLKLFSIIFFFHNPKTLNKSLNSLCHPLSAQRRRGLVGEKLRFVDCRS